MNTTSRRALSGRTVLHSALALLAFGLTPVTALAAHPQEEAAADEPSACACTCATCLAKHGPKAEAVAILDVLETLEADASSADQDLLVTALPVASADDEPDQERGYMGVMLGDVDEAVTLSSVVDGSPAAAAGLKAGDVIVAVEEMPVRTMADLQGVLAGLKPGDVASFEIERGDEEMTISFPLGSRAALELGNRALIELAVPEPPPLPDVPSADERPLRALGYLGSDVVTDTEEIESEVDFTEVAVEEILLPTEVREVSEPMRIRFRALEGAPAAPREPRPEPRPEPTRERIQQIEVRGERSPLGRTPLPPGYIEIETRRELRPDPSRVRGGVDPELRNRILRLEREVAELSEMVEDLRRELARRDPR